MTELRALQSRMEEGRTENAALKTTNQAMRNQLTRLHNKASDKERVQPNTGGDAKRATEAAALELAALRQRVTDQALLETHQEVVALRQRSALYMREMLLVQTSLLALQEMYNGIRTAHQN